MCRGYYPKLTNNIWLTHLNNNRWGSSECAITIMYVCVHSNTIEFLTNESPIMMPFHG